MANKLAANIMVLETLERAIKAMYEAQAEMLPHVPPAGLGDFKNQVIGTDAAIGTICVAISETFEVPFETVLSRFGVPEERVPYFLEIRKRTKARANADA